MCQEGVDIRVDNSATSQTRENEVGPCDGAGCGPLYINNMCMCVRLKEDDEQCGLPEVLPK